MTTVSHAAACFANGNSCTVRSAVVRCFDDGSRTYSLHGNVIAERLPSGSVAFNWCGWYTPTTANHMNHILKALAAGFRVSYAQSRDTRQDSFVL